MARGPTRSHFHPGYQSGPLACASSILRHSSTSSLTVQPGAAPTGAHPRHLRCETAPKLVGRRRVSRQHRCTATVHLSHLQGRSRPRNCTELPGVRKQCKVHQSTRFRQALEVDVFLSVTVVSGRTQTLCAPPAISAPLATSRKAAGGSPTCDGTIFTVSSAFPTATIETAGAQDVQLGRVQDE
ncbi:hypothetical protein NDU88_004583 [Pleurodeles waltl]|uniref:Uncharacterized protein n=1 Tax=Pleurodeles waltl TaxID=8319 RepID=A0AAV7RKW3_PLEWA|nr:hypothetical protein NDU88_004583 [Pleurodeles waltl]